MSALLIAVFGALGTLLRYATGVWLARLLGAHFPFGTLAVNVIGSCMLGLVAATCRNATLGGVDLRLVLGVGLLGGFTTYSSFNLELLQMLEQGALAKAAVYLGSTLGACLVFGALGLAAGRAIAGQ